MAFKWKDILPFQAGHIGLWRFRVKIGPSINAKSTCQAAKARNNAGHAQTCPRPPRLADRAPGNKIPGGFRYHRHCPALLYSLRLDKTNPTEQQNPTGHEIRLWLQPLVAALW